jgi:23S rRNA pseudouridine2605 synthase
MPPPPRKPSAPRKPGPPKGPRYGGPNSDIPHPDGKLADKPRRGAGRHGGDQGMADKRSGTGPRAESARPERPASNRPYSNRPYANRDAADITPRADAPWAKTPRSDEPRAKSARTDGARSGPRAAYGAGGGAKPWVVKNPNGKAVPAKPEAPKPTGPKPAYRAAGGALANATRQEPGLKPYSAKSPPIRATAPATPATTPVEGEREGERIAKLLARAGVASRREVERLITEERVTLNGEVVTTPATILKNLRGVAVDGIAVAAAAPARLFRFHKPSGLITAERDPAGRPTIYTALRNALPPGTPRVMPVGRLDLNTEGLLMLTNDGELKRAMELPSSGIPRTYRARTFGDVSQNQLEELMGGIEIEGIRYGSINANMERSAGHNKWIELTLTEGKNREVRRVLEYLGLQVSRLLRTRYGPFELADLSRGAAEEVRQVDVERFRKGLKVA